MYDIIFKETCNIKENDMVDINYLVERRLGQLKGFLDFSVLDGVKYKAYKGGLYDYIITSNGDIYRIEAGDMLRKIKPHKSRGYWYFNAVLETGKYKQVLVHRIVAMLFIPNPENKSEVNHKNKNTDDNSVENLEWVTKSENEKHKWATMTPEKKAEIVKKISSSRRKNISHRCRAVQCIETKKTYKSVKEAASDIGVHANTIISACKDNWCVKKKYHFKYL